MNPATPVDHAQSKTSLGALRPGARDLARLHEQFVTEQRFAARLSPVTLRGYVQSFKLLTTLMSPLETADLTPVAVTEFFRRLETRERTSGRGKGTVGVKTSTVATYRSKLNRFFGWLTAKKYIQGNPFDGMPYPRVAYEDRKYLGRSDVERIFAVLVLTARWRSRYQRKRNIALFSTLLYTGARKGELLGLRAPDIDMDRLELTIRAETSKSRIQRVVPINSKLCLALEDYLEERRRRRLQTEFLFASAGSDIPFTADGLKHLVEHVKRLSGVSFHVHQFRHTFAVNFLNNGGDIAKLKQLLGHRDIRMTSAYLRCLPTSAMRSDVESISLAALL